MQTLPQEHPHHPNIHPSWEENQGFDVMWECCTVWDLLANKDACSKLWNWLEILCSQNNEPVMLLQIPSSSATSAATTTSVTYAWVSQPILPCTSSKIEGMITFFSISLERKVNHTVFFLFTFLDVENNHQTYFVFFRWDMEIFEGGVWVQGWGQEAEMKRQKSVFLREEKTWRRGVNSTLEPLHLSPPCPKLQSCHFTFCL